ncbi:hypothetical protein OAB57_03335, partial [Bacteriovoracaceae bacterium]|nr:hypothetical protein [Bacteriovoracaceae bacterium]
MYRTKTTWASIIISVLFLSSASSEDLVLKSWNEEYIPLIEEEYQKNLPEEASETAEESVEDDTVEEDTVEEDTVEAETEDAAPEYTIDDHKLAASKTCVHFLDIERNPTTSDPVSPWKDLILRNESSPTTPEYLRLEDKAERLCKLKQCKDNVTAARQPGSGVGRYRANLTYDSLDNVKSLFKEILIGYDIPQIENVTKYTQDYIPNFDQSTSNTEREMCRYALSNHFSRSDVAARLQCFKEGSLCIDATLPDFTKERFLGDLCQTDDQCITGFCTRSRPDDNSKVPICDLNVERRSLRCQMKRICVPPIVKDSQCDPLIPEKNLCVTGLACKKRYHYQQDKNGSLWFISFGGPAAVNTSNQLEVRSCKFSGATCTDNF